jgi:hypothetical protein
MGEQLYADTDWVRNNQERYLCYNAPILAADALQHVLMARSALMVGENEMALFMYRGASKLWLQMERLEPGEWINEITLTNMEMRRIFAAPLNTSNHDC